MSSQEEPDFDVCIVGAGPAGLTCLSAIREPYSLDHLQGSSLERAHHSLKLHRQLSVCVIDPQAEWMQSWKSNFGQLRIDYLRSPVMAHPDTFDRTALLARACQTGRDQSDLLESGCADIKNLLSLGQTQVGLWKLPSTDLFLEFCDDLVERLPHRRIQGHVVGMEKCQQDTAKFRVAWKDASSQVLGSLCATTVIVATGACGRPVVPGGLATCPSFSWKDPQAFPDNSMTHKTPAPVERVLVVGGGLTAVQAALRVVKDGHTCVLCSRRPIQEKHFDISVEWFDIRVTNRNLSHIYHDSIESRLEQIKKARDGGSVPPWYMKQVEACRDSLSCWVGEIEHVAENNPQDSATGVTIRYQGTLHHFDRVILACGVLPDAQIDPILSLLEEKWPIGTHGGFPALTQDLQWGEKCPNLFVVGAMAALQVGPDAGNLMGIRRAADVVANVLECRCWLREKALVNPFEALLLESSDSETEESDQESATGRLH